jgi:hypothetical protein
MKNKFPIMRNALEQWLSMFHNAHSFRAEGERYGLLVSICNMLKR